MPTTLDACARIFPSEELTSAAGLLLALRQVRGDVTLQAAVPDLAPEAVFASDPRNALPLRP